MNSGIGRRRKAAQTDKSNKSYQDRRNEILKAAGYVFKRKGFRGTSISDIAEYMKTDRANLYYYIGSKLELLDGVVAAPVRENLRRAEEIYASELPTENKLRTLIIELMVSYGEHYPFLYVFIQENLSQMDGRDAQWAASMRKINRRYEEIVVDLIRDGIDEGSFDSETVPEIVAPGVIGIVAWTNRWFNPETSSFGSRAIGEIYADLILNGISRARGD